MALCISCPTPPGGGGGPQVVGSTPDTVHLAFAGGGWRAHTGHAAWTMSLLDSGNIKLDSVFTNVGTISSNSGGSWFSTMLMYSEDFVEAIEAPDAINTWDSIGWLGQQESLFNAAGCDTEGYEYLNCVANHYLPDDGKFYWNEVVEGIVFRDYPIDQSVTLSSPRQAWAKDKPLLLASTMLTTEVVLNKKEEVDIFGDSVTYHRWYEACLSPNTPVLDGDGGGSCSGQATTPDVTPVTFSSLPGNAGYKVPYFLPEVGSGSKFNVGYTLDYVVDTAPTASATIQHPLVCDEIPVVIAAAASSAALGFGASAVVSEFFDVAYGLEDEALGFELANSKVQFNNPDNDLSIDTLAARKFVRLADGGPTDNSGVAHLVSFLQLNDQAEGFNIVAFDNVQEIYSPGGNAADVGTDIASLFGLAICPDNQFCGRLDCGAPCVNLPDVQVFDSTVVKTTTATWNPPSGVQGQALIYTKYTVTTVDNPAFGIQAGTTGTLHSFTCQWSSADTEPLNEQTDSDFIAYANMLKFINSGLSADNQKGLKYLQAALGLTE